LLYKTKEKKKMIFFSRPRKNGSGRNE